MISTSRRAHNKGKEEKVESESDGVSSDESVIVPKKKRNRYRKKKSIPKPNVRSRRRYRKQMKRKVTILNDLDSESDFMNDVEIKDATRKREIKDDNHNHNQVRGRTRARKLDKRKDSLYGGDIPTFIDKWGFAPSRSRSHSRSSDDGYEYSKRGRRLIPTQPGPYDVYACAKMLKFEFYVSIPFYL